MSKITVGMVDYGVGNHTSVRQCLEDLGLRSRISRDPAVLSTCSILVMPGVGSFRLAMEALGGHGLHGFVTEQAAKGKPVLGICLGMQMLTEASSEDGQTRGVGLIPGEIVALDQPRWHIGWNRLEPLTPDPLFEPSVGKSFYFNHSYGYRGPSQFQSCVALSPQPIVSIIRRDNVVGLQFHPEKSQQAGHELLRNVIVGLCNG